MSKEVADEYLRLKKLLAETRKEDDAWETIEDSILEIEKVTEKQIWRFNDEDIIVCDNGLKWISILPQNDFYCITAMMNADDDIFYGI